MKEPIVRMVNIHKKFGEVQALKGVDLEVYPGEIVGLVGDNGAGKTTLAKILAGVYSPDRGEIYLDGEKVRFSSPNEARARGVGIVYQDTGLVPLMDITRNFFLGKEILKKIGPLKVLDKRKMKQEVKRALDKVGIASIRNIDEKVAFLSGGERQAIKIGRVLFFKARVVILDEPMRALSVKEVGKVLAVVERLKESQIAVVYITHNIFHIYRTADRFVILDKGIKVGEVRKEDITEEGLINIIRTGRMEAIKKTS
ncbi:sugar ABC transporter ATP-binding protein [Candidatus Aerophobetes bacterium]|uniref:Sugar ABC transporter ATP-binding protein n=1 Tax=Aerophobetes bacterium TaxID=2030807 RepID=A0A662DHV2_UNCAE|nr:MAG: sugar ABC transporter ATP-binding protein [Candidatus Aerophobetes bacterium]